MTVSTTGHPAPEQGHRRPRRTSAAPANIGGSGEANVSRATKPPTRIACVRIHGEVLGVLSAARLARLRKDRTRGCRPIYGRGR
jgi:hypothetical protein